MSDPSFKCCAFTLINDIYKDNNNNIKIEEKKELIQSSLSH